MKFFIILNINIKRMLRNKKNIIASFLLPAVVILIFGFIFSKIEGSDTQNAIINSDKGSLGQEFIKEMQKNTKIKIYEKEDGIERLKKKRLPLCYEIPENFTEMISKGEKPQIISHKREKGMEIGNFQFNANSVISKMILRAQIKNTGNEISIANLSYEESEIKVTGKDRNKMSDVIILNMLISFVLFSSIGIAMEIFELKRQNILKRSFTTSNKPKLIIGGILGAMFIIYSIAYSIIFLMNAFIYSSSDLDRIPVIILNITFLVLVALSLGVFITRLINNENLIPVVMQIVIAVTCFIGGSFMPIELLPKGITMFSKFTPQYWALESINTNNIWLSFVVVLFSLVLFTAGTFKLKNFME